MKAIKSKNFKAPVILTKILDDGSLLVVDSKTTVRYLNMENLELIDGFKAGINHLRYKTKVVDFSSDGEVFATLSSDVKESRIYNAKTKKAIAKVNRHHGEVSCVGIDTSKKYMYSCGDDGKTFAIDIKSGKLAFTLPPHADTVNDIAFSSNGNWVATAGYDKKVSVYHLAMMTPKHRLKAHAAPIIKITFIGQNRLLSADKNNTAIIWNIYSGKIVSRLQGIHDDVTQVISAYNDKFLFIGTALGYVLVYDMKSYQILCKKYIKVKHAVTSMEFDEENKHLIVSCENGDVLFYNIFEGENHLKQLLKDHRYEYIQSYVTKNPLLAYTEVYEIVSNIWEDTLEKAKRCLQNGDKNGAIVLFEPFKNIASKNKIIQNVIAEYSEYDQFSALVKQGKIALAYGLINKHSIYKETNLYKLLEAKWHKAFALAQKYSTDPKGTEKAREILAPYRGITEKSKLMQELFTKGEVYKRFRGAIGQKSFKIAFELIKIHPYLKEFPEYRSLINYGDTLYIKSQEFMRKNDTHSAVKMLRILLDFSDFSAEAKELLEDIESKQKFYNALESGDMNAAYYMLDMSEYIQNTSAGKKLQSRWNEDIDKADSFAVEGYVEGIKETLKPYISISSKYTSLASVFAWCYMNQLESALKEKEEQTVIEKGIKNYVLDFGMQDQIEGFYEIFKKMYPKTKLNIELITQGNLKSWRPSMIRSSILE